MDFIDELVRIQILHRNEFERDCIAYEQRLEERDGKLKQYVECFLQLRRTEYQNKEGMNQELNDIKRFEKERQEVRLVLMNYILVEKPFPLVSRYWHQPSRSPHPGQTRLQGPLGASCYSQMYLPALRGVSNQ